MSRGEVLDGALVVGLVRGDRVVRTWACPEGEAVIGSGEGCTITVRGDPALRPRHLRVLVDDGRVAVVAEPGAALTVGGRAADLAFVDPEERIEAGHLVLVAWLRRPAAPSTSAAAAPVAELVVSPPRGKRRRARLRPGRLLVGRVRADLTLAFDGVEDHHLTLVVRPDGTAALEAFGEVRVDDRAVSRAELSAPCRVQVGPVTLAWRSLLAPEEPEQEVTVAVPAVGQGRQRAPEALPALPPPPDVPLRPRDDPSRVLGFGLTASAPPPPAAPLSRFTVTPEPTPPAPSPVAPPAEDDEDDDDFEPPFDLPAQLLARRGVRRRDGRAAWVTAQVVRVRGGHVVETARVFPEAGWASPGGAVAVVVDDQQVVITLGDGVTGTVRPAGDLEVDVGPDGPRAMRLRVDDAARLHTAEGVVAVEVFLGYADVGAPRVLPGRLRAAVALGVALVAHLVAGTTFAQVDPTRPTAERVEVPEEVFATVAVDLPRAAPVAAAAPPRPRAPAAPAAPARAAVKPPAGRGPATTSAPAVGALLASLAGAPTAPGARLSGAAAAAPGGEATDVLSTLSSLDGPRVAVARAETGAGSVSGAAVPAARGAGRLDPGAPQQVRGQVTRVRSQARVHGSLSPEAVYEVVGRHLQDVQACYERALVRDPSLTGRIVFEWVVGADGGVKDVRVQASTVADAGVATCIRDLVAAWRFPAPDGGQVTVSYPFLFRSAAL